MSSNKASYISFLLFFLFSLSTSYAGSPPDLGDSFPVQSSTARPKSKVPMLPTSFTDEVARDWSNSKLELDSITPLLGKPDRSLRTIWVRMFPLETVPLSDPYPVTVEINLIDLECAAGMSVYNLDTQALLGSTTTLHLDFSKPTFKIGTQSVALQKLWIVPAGTVTTLRWDTGKLTATGGNADVGVKLRGQFAVKQTLFEGNDIGKPQALGQHLWSVINIVDINSYIESVVPSEIISSWETETLKAQAIAARTYGLFELGQARASGSEWDVDPSTWYQSYRGFEFYDRVGKRWLSVELSRTSQAVKDTAGEVMTYKGSIIKAFFSANSGGITCTVAECLDLPDLPYLVQVPDAADVQSLPGGSWGTKATLTPDNIKAKLAEGGVNTTQTVARVEALERGPSGRTWRLRVHFTAGNYIDLDRLQSRKIMHLYGPIRSFLYTLGAMSGGTQAINGNGFGHGVGLSQWGAQSFAKQGWSAQKILTYYYKNVSIDKL